MVLIIVFQAGPIHQILQKPISTFQVGIPLQQTFHAVYGIVPIVIKVDVAAGPYAYRTQACAFLPLHVLTV